MWSTVLLCLMSIFEGFPQKKAASLETREQSESFFEQAVEKAYSIISEHYEDSDYPDKLDFHVTKHSKDIVRRTSLILSTLRLVDPTFVRTEDVKKGEILAAWHDVKQDSYAREVTEGEHTKKIRDRKPQEGEPTNEAKSATQLKEYLDIFDSERSKSKLTNSEIDDALNVTVPGFNGKTVIQPGLTESSSIFARALALADIGGAGMDSAEQYFWEGDAVFREENMDIREALQVEGELSESQKDYFKKRMLGWSAFQEVFAQGRKDAFEQEVAPLPEDAKIALRVLFDKFDSNIEAARERAKERASMSFEQLVTSFGY